MIDELQEGLNRSIRHPLNINDRRLHIQARDLRLDPSQLDLPDGAGRIALELQAAAVKDQVTLDVFNARPSARVQQAGVIELEYDPEAATLVVLERKVRKVALELEAALIHPPLLDRCYQPCLGIDQMLGQIPVCPWAHAAYQFGAQLHIARRIGLGAIQHLRSDGSVPVCKRKVVATHLELSVWKRPRDLPGGLVHVHLRVIKQLRQQNRRVLRCQGQGTVLFRGYDRPGQVGEARNRTASIHGELGESAPRTVAHGFVEFAAP